VAASCGKIINDFGFPARISRGLLHDKPFCVGFEPDPKHFKPQGSSGSLAVDGGGNAGFLTGRPSNNDVDAGVRGESPVEFLNIVIEFSPFKSLSNSVQPPLIFFSQNRTVSIPARSKPIAWQPMQEKRSRERSGGLALPAKNLLPSVMVMLL
jgi:hypothetical protein